MKYIISLLSLFISFSLFSQEETLVKWKTIQEADSLQLNGDKRPIFTDVYTVWCGPCKMMDKNTFQNEQVANFLNEYFIPVKFNAEEKQDIIFKGREYKWVSSGNTGLQSFAYIILRGQIRYPSMPILDSSGDVLTVISGYFPPQDFIQILEELKEKIDEYTKTTS